MKKIILLSLAIILGNIQPLILTIAKADVITEKTANLFLAPDYHSYFDPDNLIIDIVVQADNQPINAVDINLLFEPNMLSAENIDYTNSFCSLFIKEEIQNQSGKIRIACGSPENNTATTTQIARIKFKKLQAGWTKLNCNESRVLANDGLGTNILQSTEYHNIYIIK